MLATFFAGPVLVGNFELFIDMTAVVACFGGCKEPVNFSKRFAIALTFVVKHLPNSSKPSVQSGFVLSSFGALIVCLNAFWEILFESSSLVKILYLKLISLVR